MSKYLCSLLLLHLLCISFLAFDTHAQQLSDQELKGLFRKNALQLHIEPSDVDNATIKNSYTDDKTGLQYVYLQQSFQDINVFNYIISIAIKGNQVLYSSGRFVKAIAEKANNQVRSIEGIDAVNKAANHLQLPSRSDLRLLEDKFISEKKLVFTPAGIAKKNIETELMWVSIDDGASVKLCWNVNIDVLNSPDWWNVRIDAVTGSFVSKDNWTVNEIIEFNDENDGISTGEKKPVKNEFNSFENPNLFIPPNVTNGAYRVVPFPLESPNHGSIAIENEPWLKSGAINNATTHGWHFDGTTNYTITGGNNVYVYEDADANNAVGIPGISSTPAPALTFNSTPDFTLQPANSTNQNFALTNLFYWNNIIHDLTYQYGFTEAAGNFQMDNLGRGGAGNDYVLAEAQDGSGYNNANFTRSPDGQSPRMQMYLFSTDPVFSIISPAVIGGQYAARENAFASPNKLINLPGGSVSGEVVWYNDDAPGTIHLGCANAANAAQLAGKIALIDATTSCGFATRVKRAQNAGAIGAILYSPNSSLITMTGTDPTIIIPAINVTLNTGNQIILQLGNGPVTVTMTSGIYRDADLDNGIIVHEYGHGVSNRLTGGLASSSCLSNAEQGGEGWSDYLGLMMTTNWSTAQITDGLNPRPMGTYALNQPLNGAGIRTYPYTTNMAVNPLTYSNMGSGATGQVHFIGTIWCTALWDMTWNIIQQQGIITPDLFNSAGTGGNVIALRLVMEGMKFQPCNPGFLDARNAILAADSVLYNGAYKCAIWNAFAKRGMGLSAVQGSSNSTTDHTAAFDVPSSVIMTKSFSPIEVNSGNNFTINLTAICDCQAPLNNFTIRDTIPAGFSYVSSTGGTLNGNIVTFSGVNFTAPLQSKSYSVTLKAEMAGCNVTNSISDNRDGSTAGGLTSSAITGSTNWVQSTLRSHSPSTSWYGANPATVSQFVLTSDAFTVGGFSILSFWHYYNTEKSYDGGVVEVSTDGGTVWQDAGPYIFLNPYSAIMDASTVLAGRKAFSGNGGTQFIRTMLNLSSFAGQSIKIRFRITTDVGTSLHGWFIDDILQLDGCGAGMKAGLYNSSDTRIDTTIIPLFVKPTVVLPVTLVSFTAKQSGKDVALNWLTTAEINAKEYLVERSGDGVSWTEIGLVTAKDRNSSNNYQYYDHEPLPGANYYRLKMIDKDLSFQYSAVRLVKFSGNKAYFVIIPNPSNQEAMLRFNTDIISPQILISDINGKVLQSKIIRGTIKNYLLETQKLAPGTYMITIRSSVSTITQKLVVIH